MIFLNNLLRNINKKKYNNTNFFFSDISNLMGNENNNIVFDVGAYNGSTIDKILMFSNKVELHAFEPNSSNFKNLKIKYGHYSHIYLNQIALSNFNGKSKLNINTYAETNSLRPSLETNDANINSLTKNIDSEEVTVLTLDEYCIKNKINNINLLKIDAQGLTYEILEGSIKLLSNQAVENIYLEVEFQKIYQDEKLFSEVELLLRSFGYKIFRLYNMNYFQDKSLAWCDVLFIKN